METVSHHNFSFLMPMLHDIRQQSRNHRYGHGALECSVAAKLIVGELRIDLPNPKRFDFKMVIETDPRNRFTSIWCSHGAQVLCPAETPVHALEHCDGARYSNQVGGAAG